jgi:hypothetical protein
MLDKGRSKGGVEGMKWETSSHHLRFACLASLYGILVQYNIRESCLPPMYASIHFLSQMLKRAQVCNFNIARKQGFQSPSPPTPSYAFLILSLANPGGLKLFLS